MMEYIVFNRNLFQSRRRVRISFQRRLYENVNNVTLTERDMIVNISAKRFPDVEDLMLMSRSSGCRDSHVVERRMIDDLLKG